jgi:uncharacterized protein (DUF952 family)
MTLLHITTAQAVAAAERGGEYLPEAFAREGFIHCSYPGQLVAVANRIFRGRRDLVVLHIDRAALECPVVDENLEGGTELYPHVYGPLPMAAVIAVHPFPCGADGRFSEISALRPRPADV